MAEVVGQEDTVCAVDAPGISIDEKAAGHANPAHVVRS